MLQKELTYIVAMDKLIKGKYLVNFYLHLGKYFSEKGNDQRLCLFR